MKYLLSTKKSSISTNSSWGCHYFFCLLGLSLPRFNLPRFKERTNDLRALDVLYADLARFH